MVWVPIIRMESWNWNRFIWIVAICHMSLDLTSEMFKVRQSWSSLTPLRRQSRKIVDIFLRFGSERSGEKLWNSSAVSWNASCNRLVIRCWDMMNYSFTVVKFTMWQSNISWRDGWNRVGIQRNSSNWILMRRLSLTSTWGSRCSSLAAEWIENGERSGNRRENRWWNLIAVLNMWWWASRNFTNLKISTIFWCFILKVWNFTFLASFRTSFIFLLSTSAARFIWMRYYYIINKNVNLL